MKLPRDIWPAARRKLDLLNAAHTLEDLKVLPGNRLEALKGKARGFYSIRVNDQYRLMFGWTGHDANDVRIIDYH
jgi:proteic killer suppression protein